MRVAFLGDSLTEGWPGASYLAALSGLLPGDELVNLGRAGDTVAAVLARLTATGLEPADLAVIWAGVNDAFAGVWTFASWEDDPAARLERELELLRGDYAALLELALAGAPRVVCVLPVLPDGGDEDEPWGRRVVAIAEAIAALAAGEPRAAVCDLGAAFAAARAAAAAPPFTIDGVHLSERGTRVVAGEFARVIEVVRPETGPRGTPSRL